LIGGDDDGIGFLGGIGGDNIDLEVGLFVRFDEFVGLIEFGVFDVVLPQGNARDLKKANLHRR